MTCGSGWNLTCTEGGECSTTLGDCLPIFLKVRASDIRLPMERFRSAQQHSHSMLPICAQYSTMAGFNGSPAFKLLYCVAIPE